MCMLHDEQNISPLFTWNIVVKIFLFCRWQSNLNDGAFSNSGHFHYKLVHEDVNDV